MIFFCDAMCGLISTHAPQSIVSHQPPPRFSDTPAATATTFPNYTRPNNSVLRPPLLSIPQLQSTTISAPSSSQSTPTSTSDYSPKLNKPLTPTREKRRKLRSTRAGSPVPASISFNASGLRPKNKQPFRSSRIHHHSEPCSGDEDYQPLLSFQRLNLKSSMPPVPPAIPQDLMFPPSQCSYAHTPIVEPSYTTPRDTPNDTYTCIRTVSNPFPVSISSQPPAGFTKSMPRLNRLNRSSISSSHDPLSSCLELRKTEEQDKWWHWAKVCKVTGDGNKSSHLAPLRCQDLKRNFDDHLDCDNYQEPSLRIQTRPFSESTIEQQKFYYSG
ncbi:hypothetical protein PGT21_028053 [Puccinia graminis f. sp. tritici]|uniref:Uncharacterized protein n=1 Tax=Puccinia graminis f. sp. tritici TaxID=56615 RepID=A0A5B0NP29_PUCGR|nr:hypothetical protein PGT21_028053 [Puccinia graminis f. sp. tritici]